MYAPIAAPAAPCTWDLEVQSLADAVTLPVATSMTAEELRSQIAEKLGIAAKNQLWHIQGERLVLKDTGSATTELKR